VAAGRWLSTRDATPLEARLEAELLALTGVRVALQDVLRE
jgi:hypothetical protein